MFILKLFMKVFLLPVMLVLIVLQVFLRITAEVFSFAAGFLTLIIFGCLLVTLVRNRLGDAMILFLLESGAVLVMLCPVLAGELLDAAGRNLGEFLRS